MMSEFRINCIIDIYCTKSKNSFHSITNYFMKNVELILLTLKVKIRKIRTYRRKRCRENKDDTSWKQPFYYSV